MNNKRYYKTLNVRTGKALVGVPGSKPAVVEGATPPPHVEPRNDDEASLRAIWEDVLRRSGFGVRDDFFRLGGNSLKATQMISRINQRFGVGVKLTEVFDHSTIESLSRLISTKETAVVARIEPVGEREFYELSYAQRRLWILDQLEEEQAIYNMPGAYVLRGALDTDAFERAFAALIERHESLRTTFVMVEGEPRQYIHRASDFSFRVEHEDLRGDADREASARALAAREAATTFDLATGPLVRARLLRMEDERYVFLFTMHHIISDGWSLTVLLADVLVLYEAFRRGAENPLAPLAIQYKDYSAWQREQLQGEQLERHQRYWREQFDGDVPVLELSGDFPRPAIKTYAGDKLGGVLDENISAVLNAVGQRAGASLFMTLLAAVNALLYRYTGQEEIIIGSPIAGRNHHELENQIGFYVNTLALRTQFSAADSFNALLDKVKAATLGAYEHQLYPFDRLVGDLRLIRDTSRSPLFDVMVVLQNTDAGGARMVGVEGVSVESFESAGRVSKFDLVFNFAETPAGLSMLVEYNTDLFKRETAERLFGHLQTLLGGVAANPEQRLSELPLLTDAERHRALIEWNATDVERVENERCIHQLFEEQAARTPAAVAVHFEGEQLSYAELNAQANRIAAQLADAGIGRGAFVPIIMERSPEVVVAMLGVMKSGAAFIPLDANWPFERLRLVLDDAEAPVVLVKSDAPPAQDLGRPVITVDRRTVDVEMPNPNHDVEVSAPIYAIYTSGSTGRPKGVVIPHRGITNRFLWMNDSLGRETASAVMQTTPHVFDSAVWQFFWPLINGGKTVLPSGDLDIHYLSNLIEQHGVTITDFVPSVFNVVVPQLTTDDGLERKLKTLRCLTIGGEEITRATAYDFLEYFPDVRLVNLYGPTEASIGCVFHRVTGREEGRIPIGRPISNARALVLDAHRNVVPVGVVGEIYLSGVPLGIGYLNDEEKTRRVFVDNPFAEIAWDKLYKTGDFGRYQADGNIECLGRVDEQVKIHGYRIEPGEIEATLMRHPSVGEAVVLARTNEAGSKHLVAYLVPAPGAPEPYKDDVRKFLREQLPDYMVPSLYVVLDALPLTQGGKLDRKKLPDPSDSAATAGAPYVAPRNDVEAKLVAAWRHVLDAENIGIHHNYFDLGGDSIHAIQIAARLHQEKLEFKIRDIFQFPTVAALAPHLKPTARTVEQTAVTGEAHPTPAQLEFLTASTPEHRGHETQSAMLHFPDGLDRESVEAIFAKINEHHDALRLTLKSDALMFEHRDARVPLGLQEFDLRETADAVSALEEKAAELRSSINLDDGGSLMRLALFHSNDGDRLLVVIHRLVIDAASWRILFEDVETLYRQRAADQPLSLPTKTDSFKTWTERLREQAGDAAWQAAQESYWKDFDADGATGIETIHDAADDRDSGQDDRAADESAVSFALSEADTSLLLHRVNRAFNTDVRDVLLAALGLAVHELHGRSQIAVALEEHSRENLLPDLDISRTVGRLSYTYPVVLDLRHASDLSRLLKEVKERLRSVPQRGIGHGMLKHLAVEARSESACFTLRPQFGFTYHGEACATGTTPTAFSVSTGSPSVPPDATSRRMHELEVAGWLAANRLQMMIRFSHQQHSTESMEKMSESFHAALLEIVAHCAGRETSEPTPSDFTYKGLSLDAIDNLFD